MNTGTKIMVGVAAVAVPLGLLGAAVGVFLLRPAPNSIAGDHMVELTLTRDAGDGAAEGAVMVQRLSDFGVGVELIEAGPGRVRLRAHDVTSPDAVAEVVTPGRRLAFFLVDESVNPFAPDAIADPPAGAQAMSDGQRTVLGGASASAAREIIARAALPANRSALVECRERGEPGVTDCFPRLVELPAVLTGDSLASASAPDDDPMAYGGSSVLVEFDAAGARRFGEVTGAAIHRKLAIVLDQEILSCPMIQSAIPGGRAMITLGPGHSHADAELLAAGLRPGRALGGTWQVERGVVVTPGE